MKNKPISNGLKYYAICDPEGGFVYATMLHSKQPIPFETIWGRVNAVVVHLLRGQGVEGAYSFLDQGYCVRLPTLHHISEPQLTCPIMFIYRFQLIGTTPESKWRMAYWSDSHLLSAV